jgi:hypothetical protein
MTTIPLHAAPAARVQAARARHAAVCERAGGKAAEIAVAGHIGSLLEQLQLLGMPAPMIDHFAGIIGAALREAAWIESDAIHELLAEKGKRLQRWGDATTAIALEQAAAELRARWRFPSPTTVLLVTPIPVPSATAPAGGVG